MRKGDSDHDADSDLEDEDNMPTRPLLEPEDARDEKIKRAEPVNEINEAHSKLKAEFLGVSDILDRTFKKQEARTSGPSRELSEAVDKAVEFAGIP